MIGIFSRWRQLGRKYFWPHLFFGMVAASLGLPVANTLSSDNSAIAQPNTQLIAKPMSLEQLIRLRDSGRRIAGMDYWQQHAIRVVIRHLSFSVPPHALSEQERASQQVQELGILFSLYALLSAKVAQPIIDGLVTELSFYRQLTSFSIGPWRSTVGGIRAGPLSQ